MTTAAMLTDNSLLEFDPSAPGRKNSTRTISSKSEVQIFIPVCITGCTQARYGYSALIKAVDVFTKAAVLLVNTAGRGRTTTQMEK